MDITGKIKDNTKFFYKKIKNNNMEIMLETLKRECGKFSPDENALEKDIKEINNLLEKHTNNLKNALEEFFKKKQTITNKEQRTNNYFYLCTDAFFH